MLHAADCNCSSSRGGTRCNCTACAQWATEVQKYARKKRELFSVKKRGRQKIKKYWLAQSADLPTARLAGLALVLWSKPKENTSPRLRGDLQWRGGVATPSKFNMVALALGLFFESVRLHFSICQLTVVLWSTSKTNCQIFELECERERRESGSERV